MPALAAWQVESFRATFFPTMESGADWAQMWPASIGVEAESQVRRAALRLTVQEGMWNGLKLTVSTQPERTDIIVSRGDVEGASWPTIGTFDEVLEKFKQLLPSYFGRQIARVAFGADLLREAADKESAYREIAAYLPSVKIDPETRDFIYQINRQKRSKHANVLINRLNNWSVIGLHRLMINAGTFVQSEESFACKLLLDCSSDAHNLGPFNEELTLRLFFELVEQGRDIAEYGDRS
jgi:hypothetical protein